jgi:hypothetical protein
VYAQVDHDRAREDQHVVLAGAMSIAVSVGNRNHFFDDLRDFAARAA